MNQNDLRIKELQAKILEQEKNIGEKPLFIKKTNCVLTIDNTTYNLHVLTLNELIDLTAKLFTYELGFFETLSVLKQQRFLTHH